GIFSRQRQHTVGVKVSRKGGSPRGAFHPSPLAGVMREYAPPRCRPQSGLLEFGDLGLRLRLRIGQRGLGRLCTVPDGRERIRDRLPQRRHVRRVGQSDTERRLGGVAGDGVFAGNEVVLVGGEVGGNLRVGQRHNGLVVLVSVELHQV